MAIESTDEGRYTEMKLMRDANHITDTRAVRKVISEMDDNWLIRSLEERDYGVDLQLEIFRNGLPTGEMALVQVKGTLKKFDNAAKLPFPTKTIEYALLFQQTFFAFHVSLQEGSVRYIWIQRYARLVLGVKKPLWRDQDKVTLSFPAENNLRTGKKKLEGFLQQSVCRDEAIRVRSANETAVSVFNHRSILTSASDIEFVQAQVLEMERCTRFWSQHDNHHSVSFDMAKRRLTDMKAHVVSYGEEKEQLEYVNSEIAKELESFFTSVQSAYEVFTENLIGDALCDGDIENFPY